MSKFLVPIIFVVAALGGGGGGYFAKQILSANKAEEEADDAHGENDDGSGDHNEEHGDGHHEDDKSSDGHSGDDYGDSHGDDHAQDSKKKSYASSDDHSGESKLPEDVGYFKFGRQFVVPLIDNEGVSALVIMDINLEMASEAADSFYYREPKFRDILMQELMDLANQGRFDGRLTDRRNLNGIRADLLKAIEEIAGDSIEDVLILDIMRQAL